MLDKYLVSAQWEELEPNGSLFTLYTAAIDGVETTDSGEVADFLYLLFVACDQKVEDLSVLLADPMEMEGAAHSRWVP